MADTALPLGMSPLGLTESLTQSFYQRTDAFWRVNDVTAGRHSFPADITRVIPTIPEKHAGAYVAKSYSDHFFNNIFLIPTSIDFGAVIADVTRTFFIWNAYFRSVDLEAVTASNAEGISLTNPTPPPSTYKPLQFTQLSVTAHLNGPPTIDGRFNFVFDVRTMSLALAGLRAEIWDMLPNWSAGYKISYEYKTEIITSRSGREQRRALRQTPRKWLEFSVHAAHDKAWRLRGLFDAWQDKAFILPELTRSITTTSGVAANARIMIVDSVPDWLRPGAFIVLRNGNRHGMRIVESIDDDEVTFTSVSPDTWPEGTLVHPGLFGRVQVEQAVNNLTSNVSDLSFRYDVTPASEGVDDAGTPFPDYNGSELFLKKPNWANAPRVNFQAEVEKLDYGRGVAEFLTLLDFRRRIVQATFLSRNRAEAIEIEQFFRRMKGRRGTFYMPTYQPDIVPASDLSQLNRFMTVAGPDLLKFYQNSPVYRHMFIRFHDGSHLIRPVIAISEQAGNSIIDVGTNWPRDIAISEILMICWLPRWRLASDILTIEWLTDEVAQFQMSMQTQEDIEA